MLDFAACNPAHQVLVTAQRGSACILIKGPGNEAAKVHGLVQELVERSRQKASSFHFFSLFSLLNVVLDQTQDNSDLTCLRWSDLAETWWDICC